MWNIQSIVVLVGCVLLVGSYIYTTIDATRKKLLSKTPKALAETYADL